MVKKIRMISAVGFMLGIFIACNRNYNFWYRYIHDIVGFFYLEYQVLSILLCVIFSINNKLSD